MQAGPSDTEVISSKMWLYRSTVDMTGDANAGLLGPLIVTRASAALPNRQPKDVSQSFVLIFQVLSGLELREPDKNKRSPPEAACAVLLPVSIKPTPAFRPQHSSLKLIALP